LNEPFNTEAFTRLAQETIAIAGIAAIFAVKDFLATNLIVHSSDRSLVPMASVFIFPIALSVYRLFQQVTGYSSP
jgi:hypothetical protein